MEFEDSRRNSNLPVIISFVFTFFFFLVGLIIDLITNDKEIYSFQSFLNILIENKVLLILLAQVILIPVSLVFYLRIISKIQEKIGKKIASQETKNRIVTEYIGHLIDENYDEELEVLDNKDILKKSLTNLRNTLKTNKQIVEKQRTEDEKRNWHAEGHARFGEILRNNNDFEKLAFNVVKELTDYVGAIQGGFFHLEEENGNKFFNLIAFYAYGRKKYADKTTPWGKGLIGTAAREQKTIHMENIPNGYVSVTSGLGKTNPNQLIVAPMVSEGELFGVLEITSLNEFTEDHINFIEKVAGNTASTLSTVRMNLQTSQLLKESKEQAQALASQEEEMRQNMEELKATQEEAARQAERFLRLENTVNHTMIRAEYNIDGILLYANTNFLKKLEYTSNSQVEGKHISMFLSKKDEEWFNNIWKNLSQGGRHFEGYMKHVSKSGKDLWTMATYTCIRDENGEAERILFLALDTTEQKKISLNLEGFVEAVNRSSIKIEFDTTGNIKTFSELFLYLFKYSEKEVAGLNVMDLIDPLELETFGKKWENIVNGMNFEGQFKVKSNEGKECWIQGAFSCVYNMYGEVEKVIFIGHDITNQKFMEIEFKNQNEILKKQEALLRESEKELSRKLREAKLEMQEQFKEIENNKIRNERTLEGALDAIIQTSKDNKIIFYNKAAELLLGYKKEEVLNKNVGILFSEDTAINDSFVSKYIQPGDSKLVGVRTEIKMLTKDSNELSVLILLSKAQVEKEITYTAFIQTIEVELF
ncbi:MAG: PAS domain S-box protein [Bacteroidales bacterium]|nr:PAS domain S-box protein [Bacteroidales bacterium]MBN2820160.1 PAS domain S-box protein [Bacteroidales bacterium]